MLTPKTVKRQPRSYAPKQNDSDASADLKFITELGRSLLFTVHPKKVAARVAEAIQLETAADVCAVIVELEHIGLVSYTFTHNGPEPENEWIDKTRFREWGEILPPQVSYVSESDFLLRTGLHSVEYVSPLHINGEIKGAIVCGFVSRTDCSERSKRIIDAATQLAAMSINLSAHYEAAINDSINRAREEHRKFTEAVLDALPVSIYVIDRDYRIVSWNRHREIGNQGMVRDSVIGRNVFQVFAKYPQGKLRQEFERAFETGQIERIEQQTVADNGATQHWMVSKIPMRNQLTGDVTHVITVGEDVTMRVDAIHAAGRAEKLAAVGRLAAGVVHEINNPLATISACAESLETRVNEGEFGSMPEIEDLREYLGLIRSEAFRCKAITNGLLDFSRVRSGNRLPIDIADLLQSSANLVSHQKRGNAITFKFDIAADLPAINADGGQIQQAIIALATNAIDAMPNGGTLTFKAYATNEQRVTIEVQDTGIGIPSENMSKVFEPFFTTKEVGKGTGLGLAVCYGIITEHGGRLSVRSNLGIGTTFTIFLPNRI
ncbi:MAG: PAS domain-containing protein [Acidobacteria bacterium]|nr:PAS domain-containing protein [Acidobacteriota bacterium]MBK8147969.1 PAS domain-containing protein [Acidobacteriota bacterium]MBK8813536.1 PAS domain-containing protein [Acidobacteriota bacterium]